MLRLGRVIHTSPTNSNISVVKAENIPPIGAKVTDENGSAMGFVFDVFGSASSPFIEIEGIHGKDSIAIGKILFYKRSFKRKRKGRRRR